jgi:hypothetical protein
MGGLNLEKQGVSEDKNIPIGLWRKPGATQLFE